MMNKEKDIESIIIRSLSGAANTEEKELLKEWLREAEANRWQYEQARHLWDTAAEVDYSIDPQTDAEWDKLIVRMGNSGSSDGAYIKRLKFWRYAAAAVVILGLAGLAALYLGGGLGRGPAIAQQYETLPGQTRQLALSDGSFINLNAGSTLSVIKGFGLGERRLILEGEAFFQVSHDPQQPFTVTMNGAEVRVTGTAFNLRAYPENEAVQLAVTEGSVAFRSENSDNGQAVKAGQAAKVDRATGRVSTIPFDERATAWQSGLIVFDSTLFPEVLRTLERQFAVEIEDNTQLQQKRYTATFDNRSLDEILSVMGATMSFQVDKRGGKVVLR